MENRTYKVKFCRTGSMFKHNGKRHFKAFNHKQEGSFTLQFKSMEDLVKFMVQTRSMSIHPVDGINQYMTPEEFTIFNKKYRAYWNTVYHT